jgi:hypothetical protein
MISVCAVLISVSPFNPSRAIQMFQTDGVAVSDNGHVPAEC